MLTTSGKNQLLGNTDVTHGALHSAFPGQTLANEIAGGSPAYAREGMSWGTPSGGQVATTNAQTFDVPPSTTVKWISGATASTAGSGRFASPNGASPKKFVIDVAGDFIQSDAHGYANDTRVTFYGATAPGGLTEGTDYFVVNTATDKFQVSATVGGSAINLTSEAGDGCRVSVIIPETFGGQGTMTLAIGATIQSLNQ